MKPMTATERLAAADSAGAPLTILRTCKSGAVVVAVQLPGESRPTNLWIPAYMVRRPDLAERLANANKPAE